MYLRIIRNEFEIKEISSKEKFEMAETLKIISDIKDVRFRLSNDLKHMRDKFSKFLHD